MPLPSRNRNNPPSTWNRLKPAPRDDLTAYGFPSKGETRLNDFKAQEAYYQVIFERYMRFCSVFRADLASEFAKLSLTTTPSSTSSSSTATAGAAGTAGAAAKAEPSPELTLIFSAMRKLREAITSSRRTDDFARSTTLFIIRAALLVSYYPLYLPALTHLVSSIAPSSPLSPADARAVAIYRTLDALCRVGDLAGGLRLRCVLGLQGEAVVEAAVRALVHGEWGAWWREKGKVDGYVRALMDMGEGRVVRQALKVVSRAYLRVERRWLEGVVCGGKTWEEIRDRDGIGWEVDGDDIVVRKVKSK